MGKGTKPKMIKTFHKDNELTSKLKWKNISTTLFGTLTKLETKGKGAKPNIMKT
jgi:hypothetical protein